MAFFDENWVLVKKSQFDGMGLGTGFGTAEGAELAGLPRRMSRWPDVVFTAPI